MKTKTSPLAKIIIGLLAVVAILAIGGGIGINNSIQRLRNQVDEAWANVGAQYQRRTDLVVNLVNTVKSASIREQEILTKVIQTRNDALNALNNSSGPQNNQAAQDQLTQALSQLRVVVERYPELTSQKGYLYLQNQLEGTENRIRVARSDYNSAVRKYNDRVSTFPVSLLHIPKKEYFKANDGTEKVPVVDLGN